MIKTRFLLRLSTKIDRTCLAQVRRDHASALADESKRVLRTLKLYAFQRRLLFDVLANAVLAGAAGFNAVAALIKRKIVECPVEVNLSGIEMIEG